MDNGNENCTSQHKESILYGFNILKNDEEKILLENIMSFVEQCAAQMPWQLLSKCTKFRYSFLKNLHAHTESWDDGMKMWKVMCITVSC